MICQPHSSGGLSNSISSCFWREEWVPEHPPLCSGGYLAFLGINSTQGCLMGICLSERGLILTSSCSSCASKSTYGLSSSFRLRLDWMTSEVLSSSNDSVMLPPQIWLGMRTCSAHPAFRKHGWLLFAFVCAQHFLNIGNGGDIKGTSCCAGGLGWEGRRVERLRGCCRCGRCLCTPG